MNKDLKAKWIDALRSGEYKQCRGAWMENDGYCCVGVLLKITGHDVEVSPRETAVQLGISDAEDQPGPDYSVMQRIINQNDVVRLDFPAIADYIEKNL